MKNWRTTSTRKMICALSRLARCSGSPLKKQNSKGVKKDENMDHKKIIFSQQLQNLSMSSGILIPSLVDHLLELIMKKQTSSSF